MTNLQAPFRIKICGIRRPKDVQACVQAGADAVGLNLYPPSVRYVEPNLETTKQLSQLARDAGLIRFGVFVNETVDHMLKVADQLSLDGIQLHGDEPISAAQRLVGEGRLVLRAIRIPVAASHEIMQSHIDPWLGEPWMGGSVTILIDADAGTQYGGGGQTLQWDQLPRLSGLVLAGGLNATNVATAIALSGVQAVDVASGVESPRGVKDAKLIEQFVAEARRGWSSEDPEEDRQRTIFSK